MKECKKRFNKFKGKLSHRPPNEIDFGLGWKTALEWVLAQETVKPLLGGTKHRYIDSIAIRNEINDQT